MAEVNFKHGSFSDYQGITPESGTLYFITDRPGLFMGKKPIVGVSSANVTTGSVGLDTERNIRVNNVSISAYSQSGDGWVETAYTFSTLDSGAVNALTSYVQSQLGNYVAKSGDTMHGDLRMSGASVVFETWNKDGVMTGSVSAHCLGSGTVTGGGITQTEYSGESAFSYSTLALESTAGTDNKSVLIRNVSWPDSNLDAVNKLYVDAQIAGVVGGAIQSINYIKSVKINGFTVSGASSGADAKFTLSGGNYITISDSTSVSNTIGINADQVRISAATEMNQGLADAYDVKQYISGVSASIIAQSDAMVYKGTVSEELSAGTYNKGWTYRVSSSFSGYGHQLEAGDMIIVNNDITESREVTSEDVDIIQANIDGAVTTTGFLPVDGITGSNGQVVIATGSHETISLANPPSSGGDKVLTCRKGIVQWFAPTEDTDTKYTILHSEGALNTVELSGSDGETSVITIDNVASAGVANSASVANHVGSSFMYIQDSIGSTGNNSVTYNGSASAEIKSTSALTSGHTASEYNYLVTEAAVVNYVNNSKPQWSAITGN